MLIVTQKRPAVSVELLYQNKQKILSLLNIQHRLEDCWFRPDENTVTRDTFGFCQLILAGIWSLYNNKSKTEACNVNFHSNISILKQIGSSKMAYRHVNAFKNNVSINYDTQGKPRKFWNREYFSSYISYTDWNEGLKVQDLIRRIIH